MIAMFTFNGSKRTKDTGEHGNALFGKGVRERARIAMPLGTGHNL